MNAELPIELTISDVQALRDGGEDFYFMDCRQVEEYNIAKIAGAELIPMHELPNRVGELEPHRSKRIVIHCHHGGRSLQVAQWLRQQGFIAAQSMSGGIDAWAIQVDPAIPRY